MSALTIEQVVRDHSELRTALHEFSINMTGELKTVSGKVDTAIVLLAKVNERQDRVDDKVERLEDEINHLRQRNMEDREAMRREMAKQREADRVAVQVEITKLSQKVWTWGGALGLVAFLAPIAVTLIVKLVL